MGRGGWRGGGLFAAALCLAWLAVLAGPAGAQTFPAFSAPVVDEAGVVPDAVEQQVDQALRDYQGRTTNQIAVAVVRTTGSQALEAYSLALANSWGVGQRGKDNGVLLLIAYDDRRVRIEVGRGLVDVLTDDEAARIIDGSLAPRLRSGDVGGAVASGTEEIRRTLGDPDLVPQTSSSQTDRPYRPPTDAPESVDPPLVVDPSYDDGSGGFPMGGLVVGGFVMVGVLAVLRGAGRTGRGLRGRAGYEDDDDRWWRRGGGGGWWRSGGGGSSGLGGGGSFGGDGSSGSSGGGSSGSGGGGSFGGGGASGSW